MDKLLQHFHRDKHTLNAVAESLDTFLAAQITERVFQGKDIAGYKEARDVFRAWVRELDKIYKEDKQDAKTEYSQSE